MNTPEPKADCQSRPALTTLEALKLQAECTRNIKNALRAIKYMNYLDVTIQLTYALEKARELRDEMDKTTK